MLARWTTRWRRNHDVGETDPALRAIRVTVETVDGGGFGFASHAEVVVGASPTCHAGTAILTRVAGTGVRVGVTTDVRVAGDEAAVVDALLIVTARAIDRASASIGKLAAKLGHVCTGLRCAAVCFVADLTQRTGRHAIPGRVTGQTLAGGAVAADECACAAVGNRAAPPLACARGAAAAGSEADLVGGAGVVAGAAILPVVESGAHIAAANLAGRAALG